MKRKRIVVLGGGWSREKEVSIKSSKAVYDNLDRDRYDVLLCDPAVNIRSFQEDLVGADLVFSLLHGRLGEDGAMQGMLDVLGVPYVGSGVIASAAAFNKRISKEIYRSCGIAVPKGMAVFKETGVDLEAAAEQFGLPVVVKPTSEGSSIGVSICESLSEIVEGLSAAFECGDEVLIEEYVKGREVTCCVIGRRSLETLPLIEIRPRQGRFFDYGAKYTAGATDEICPAPIPPEIAERAAECAMAAHRALGCSVWSRTDMIIRGEDILVLETNTIPGMTENSLFPLAAKAAGLTFASLVDRLVSLSLEP